MNKNLTDIIQELRNCRCHISVYTDKDKNIIVVLRDGLDFKTKQGSEEIKNVYGSEEVKTVYTFENIDKTNLTENTLYLLGDCESDIINKSFESEDEDEIDNFCDSDYLKNIEKYTRNSNTVYYDSTLELLLTEPGFFDELDIEYKFFSEVCFVLSSARVERAFKNFIEFNNDEDNDIINIDYYQYDEVRILNDEEENNMCDGIAYIEGEVSNGEIKITEGDIDVKDFFEEEKYRAREREEDDADND